MPHTSVSANMALCRSLYHPPEILGITLDFPATLSILLLELVLRLGSETAGRVF
jgi:hypothetical protein